MTTGKQEGEWIPWSGGECPVDPDASVAIRTRAAPTANRRPGAAWRYSWTHGCGPADIIAYRVVNQP